MIKVEKLNPFGRMCVSLGMLPSSYKESLTYEEQLLWFMDYLENTVIPTVNNNADAVEELQSLFTQLQSYVDNYFDDLDVTEEINNKLDQMALDGTLTLLIKGYVDPIYQSYENSINETVNNQNEEIDNFTSSINSTISDFEARLSATESGSPLVASSTSEMTDTTKVYVNTTDGKWYYYDGDSWEIGGTYQATAIANNSVTYNNLESELQNSYTEETTIVTSTFTNGKYIQGNGTEASTSQAAYITVTVNPLDSYLVSVPYNTSIIGSQQPVYMFKYNNSVVSYKKGNEVTITEGVFSDTIEIPNGVDTLIINQTQAGSININNTLSIVKVNKYVPTDIHKEQLDSKLKSIFEDNYTGVTPTLFVNNALMGVNDVAALNGYKVYSLSVNPGEKYKITSKQIYNNPILTFGNANASKTYTINGDDYVFKCTYDKIVGTSGEQFTNYEFTIPDNCNVIYLNQEGNTTLTLLKANSYKVKVTDYDVSDLNPLNDKTIMFVGDSICAATTEGVKGWATLISENNPTTTIYNYGQDGATIADDGQDTNNVLTKIQTMYTDHPNADYIIIQGGVNDYWSENIELGNFNEHSNFNNDPSYDTTTFSGALEWIFNYCLTHFGGKKVGYIVTQKINSGSSSFYQYMNRAKEICDKWSIPYIDLFNEGDLNYFVGYQKQNYSLTNVIPTGDGTHPNLAGYQIITPKIENWLKYIV